MVEGPKSPNDLKARADAGDASAQYAFSSALSGAGRREEARHWLEQAAASGHPDAIYTLSAAWLTGANGVPREPKRGAAGVRRAAALGSAFAHCALAALHAGGLAVECDWSAACDHLAEAISRGHAGAMRMAAMVFFMADPDDLDGAALIESSARLDGVAGAIAVRRAALRRRGASSKTARELVPRLRQARYPIVEALEAALHGAAPIEEAPGAVDPDRLLAKLKRQSFDAGSSVQQLCERPNVRTISAAFTPEECDYMIGVAAPRLERAMINDDNVDEARIDPRRTAWNASLHPGSADLPFVLYAQRLSMLAAVSYKQGETLNILRYRIGEEYRPHHDFLASSERDLARRGQRIRTALIYLNEDFEGGETHFLMPDIKFLGAPGDVIVFDNVDEEGRPDVSARHASLPVRRGEKWIASLWFRDQPYEF